jgi:hypothetical protein
MKCGNVSKRSVFPVWAEPGFASSAASRQREGRVITFEIGVGLMAYKFIYRKVKALRPNAQCIFTVANSCYGIAFNRMRIKEPHVMARKQTHLIEKAQTVASVTTLRGSTGKPSAFQKLKH